MPNELKPCPFCGGKADLITHSFWNEKKQAHTDKTYSVKCFICLAESHSFYETEQLAAEAWNRRVDND